MFIIQTSTSMGVNMGNLFYNYIESGYNIEKFYKLYPHFKIINIILTVTKLDDITENSILPKKFQQMGI